MKKAMFGFALFMMVISSNAFAGKVWTNGWGQGVEEASVEPAPGNLIYLGCEPQPPESSKPPVNIEIKVGGKLPDSEMYVKFDGEEPFYLYVMDGWVDVESNAGMAISDKFVKLLQTKKQVNIMFKNGDNMTFPLKGAKKAVGECLNYLSTGQ